MAALDMGNAVMFRIKPQQVTKKKLSHDNGSRHALAAIQHEIVTVLRTRTSAHGSCEPVGFKSALDLIKSERPIRGLRDVSLQHHIV